MSVVSVDSFSEPPLREREDGRRATRRTTPSIDPAFLPKRRAPYITPDAAAYLPAEIAFLAAHGVPDEALRYGAALARRQGVHADAALISEGVVGEADFYRALAAHMAVEFLADDFDLAPDEPANEAAERGYARLRDDSRGRMWLFAPSGAAITRLIGAARAAKGRPRFAITTRTAFLEALRSGGEAELAAIAAHCAEHVDPTLCARPIVARRAIALTLGAAVALLACLLGPWRGLSLAVALCFAIVFLASSFLRLFACAASFERKERRLWLADAELPVTTVVIALYREAAVARQLAAAIDRLDYPRAKLDVKFVIEDGDIETALALRAHAPRAPHEIIVAPRGAPRTKPRALNVAMSFARGDLIAVFDAEDLPNPRQLRRAAALFAIAPASLGCLQASLVIDNAARNWITALFAIDYAALFDVCNKGLVAMGLPLFLGGTSNHFRIEALRRVGFWDAYNVTEDADLGLRLARAGYSIETFDCETLEEAPVSFAALLKQRTRWLKGWMLTALAHCRNPRRFVADFGAARAGAVLALFAGGVAGPLFGPVLSLYLLYHAAFGRLLTPETAFEAAFSALWCYVALSGAAAFLWPLFVGMHRRGLTRHWRALPLLPVWTLMLTLAAWRAAFELWRRPFHWDKTEHGLSPRGETPHAGPTDDAGFRRTATS